jgi:hypothetical protein
VAVSIEFTRDYLLVYEYVWTMVSEQFRDDASTVPGMFAILLVVVAAGLTAISRSIAMIRGFWILVVGLWVAYMLYRLVVAVEMLAEEDTQS